MLVASSQKQGQILCYFLVSTSLLCSQFAMTEGRAELHANTDRAESQNSGKGGAI